MLIAVAEIKMITVISHVLICLKNHLGDRVIPPLTFELVAIDLLMVLDLSVTKSCYQGRGRRFRGTPVKYPFLYISPDDPLQICLILILE